MRRRGWAAALLGVGVCLGAVAGCASPGDDESKPTRTAVFDSVLPAADPITPAGPTYLTTPSGGGEASVTVAGVTHGLGTQVEGGSWLADGRLLVERGDRLQLIDPASGRELGRRPRQGTTDAAGVTTEGIAIRHALRSPTIELFDLDLHPRRTVALTEEMVDSDQFDSDDATLSAHGTPLNLGNAVWVEWSVDSEDESLDDHGTLRIDQDSGTATEVLRDQPLVRLSASRDGAALLAVMQDNGEDRDCGGCVVEQQIVEIDPGSGTIAARYPMPADYDRFWRIDALDKVGDEVVARFQIGQEPSAEDPLGEAEPARQTWIYDGHWRELAESEGTRTRWQPGGRLVWEGRDPTNGNDGAEPFALTWHPDAGAPKILQRAQDRCPKGECPFIEAPGSLLP